MIRFALLIFCGGASAAILEDVNARGWTLLYSINGNTVRRERCTSAVQPKLNRADCKPDGREFDRALFRQELAGRTSRDRTQLAHAAQQQQTRITAAERAQAECRAQIAALERQRPKPLDRLRTVAARFQAAEADERRARDELTTTRGDLSAWDDLDAQLSDAAIRAYADTAETPPAGMRWVRAFDAAFLAAQGKSFGRNTWWDRSDGRVWRTDFRAVTWRDGAVQCPDGFALLSANAGADPARASLRRLRAAFENDETAFERAPREFWGAKQNGGTNAFVYRAWAVETVGADAMEALHPMMYLSQNPQK